jgi:hypothetical protein
LVKVNQNTVMRYARLAGGHARKLHDELVAVSPLTAIQSIAVPCTNQSFNGP